MFVDLTDKVECEGLCYRLLVVGQLPDDTSLEAFYVMEQRKEKEHRTPSFDIIFPKPLELGKEVYGRTIRYTVGEASITSIGDFGPYRVDKLVEEGNKTYFEVEGLCYLVLEKKMS